MSQHVFVKGIDDFDPTVSDRATLQAQFERLTKRLNGLTRRLEDLEQFKIDLQKDRPYLTVAVAQTYDKDKSLLLDRHFYMPLETEESLQQIVALTQNSERVLREEIDFVKGLIRKVLDAY